MIYLFNKHKQNIPGPCGAPPWRTPYCYHCDYRYVRTIYTRYVRYIRYISLYSYYVYYYTSYAQSTYYELSY